MKLSILTTSYPSDDSDYSGIFIKHFLQNLPKEVKKIVVCTPHKSKSISSETEGSVFIKRFHYWYPYSYEKLLLPGGIMNNISKYWLAKIQIIPFFFFGFLHALKHSKKTDIIHAHWLLYGLIARFIHMIRHTPYVITVHGTDVVVYKKNFFTKKLATFVLSKAKTIICVSSFLKKEVSKLTHNKKIFVYPNGVGNAEKYLKKGKKYSRIALCNLLWVGRFSKEKNIPLLIEVVHLLKKENKKILLRLIGSGSEKESIEKLISDNKLEGSIQMLGPVKPSRLIEYYNTSDVFLLPSLREGFGVVLIEAMASGLPVIGSNIDGIPDIIKQENGILCDPKTPADFKNAVCTLYENAELRKKMGSAGRYRVRNNYLWTDISRKIYLNIYKLAVNHG